MQRMLDGMTGMPAFVQNGRLDMLAVNTLAGALYADLFDTTAAGVNHSGRLPNHARFTFLDPRAVDFYPDRNLAAATGGRDAPHRDRPQPGGPDTQRDGR